MKGGGGDDGGVEWLREAGASGWTVVGNPRSGQA